MRQFLRDLRQNLLGIWRRLDGGQRLVVVAMLVASAVGITAMLWYAGQPSYETVFDATTGDDLREARRLLTQAGVPFVPDESGQSLRVERARVAAANSALLEGGLRGGGDRSLPATSIIEDADTKAFRLDAALRAQAQAAIAQLAGVQSATVAASRPRRSPFRDRDQDTQPRATVALKLKPGVPFEAVAHSAASLAASQLTVPLQNVDVVNAVTHQRWRFDPDRETGGGSSEFLAQQRELSDERTALAQEALDAIYPGKAVVTVSVELDPQWQITNEKMLPPEPVVLSEQTTKDSTENSESAGTGASGDPSTAATAGEATGHRNNTKKEMRDRKYLADVGERRSGRLAPEIKRVSVALLYDRSLEQKQGFNKDELAGVVKSIVGWDGTRRPQDTFSTMAGDFPVAEPAVAAGAAGPGRVAQLLKWAPAIGQVLGVALVLLFLRGLLKSRAPAASRKAALPGGAQEEQLPPAERQQRMRREIERAIASDPAALARILESWLAESKV